MILYLLNLFYILIVIYIIINFITYNHNKIIKVLNSQKNAVILTSHRLRTSKTQTPIPLATIQS